VATDENAETSWYREVEPKIEQRLSRAVNEVCSCGGRGPEDEGVCDACMVYHLFHGWRPT